MGIPVVDTDFYDIEKRIERMLTYEEQQIIKNIKNFVAGKDVIETVKQCNIEGKPIPVKFMREMGQRGAFGANLPDEDGNKISNLAYGVIMRELESLDSALRSAASVQSGLVMYPIWRFGTSEQKAKWLPSLRSGEKIGCFGATEPHGGSDVSGIKLAASPNGNCYVLNGPTKTWITHGSIADVAVVWAKTPDGIIHGFLVEKETSGFEASSIKNKGSLRASLSSILSFDNCQVPKKNVLPEAVGAKALSSCFNQARYGIAWGAGGILRKCYEAILERLDEHAPMFGEPLLGKQLVQAELAFMSSCLTVTQSLCFDLACLKDEFDTSPVRLDEKKLGDQIAMAKLLCVKLADESVDKCVELAGADGTTYDLAFWAHSQNLKVLRTYEGTEKIHMLIQGKRITGISAF